MKILFYTPAPLTKSLGAAKVVVELAEEMQVLGWKCDLVSIKAMSVGTPAICHRSGGPADFINDGEDGLLADALTADAYAARIQAALSDTNAWNRLSAATSKKAQGWHSSVMLDKLEAALYAANDKRQRDQPL